MAMAAPVRAKSFPLKQKTIFERQEDELLIELTRAMSIAEEEKLAEEKLAEAKLAEAKLAEAKLAEERLIQERLAEKDKMAKEARESLLSGLPTGRELLKQLQEQADAHEEQVKRSDWEQVQVGLPQVFVLLFLQVFLKMRSLSECVLYS